MSDMYERALALEPELSTIARLVDLLVARAPKDEPYCCGCLWEIIIKPLTLPWVGWGRQHTVTNDDPLSETYWLHSIEAYDVVTDHWLRALEAVDPSLGHGIPR